MTTFNHYLPGLEFKTQKIKEIYGNLNEQQRFFRPYNSVNHATWIVGHITTCRLFLANILAGTKLIELYENEDKLFSKGSILSENNNDYPDASTLLTHLESRGVKLAEVLQQVTPEALKRERKLAFAFGGKTVEDAAHFLLWHEATHYGELHYLNNIIQKNAGL